jgi:FkbM family methyltransferase
MTPEMQDLVRPFGVTCVDGYKVRQQFPSRILNGWELKPYAIINSAFAEVLLLDADNVPVKNPEYLFNTAEYSQFGAIFWPDYGRLKRNNDIWQITQIPYRDEPEFESGQIIVDKRRCWRALQVTMHLNEHSDFYYRYIHGDKDTFHIGWRKIEQAYAMPAHSIFTLSGTMCQHDFNGNRIFQHRNLNKWSVSGNNARVAGFWFEAECLQFVSDLESRWSVVPKKQLSPESAALQEQIKNQRHYMYVRVGYDARPIALLPGGVVASGKDDAAEHTWAVIGPPQNPRIGIFSGGNLLADLAVGGQGMLHGAWTQFEKMPCVLLPIKATNLSNVSTIFWAAQYGEDIWLATNCELPRDGFFVEVGGGTGIRHSNTYWLEQLGWRGLVVEADPRNLQTIKAVRNVELAHYAAASFDGETIFTQCEDSTLSGVLRDTGYNTISVAARRLDTLLHQLGLPAPNLISVDTEGSELDVLLGLGDMRPEYLIVERGTIAAVGEAAIEHVDTTDTTTAIRAALGAMGYAVIHQTPGNLIARYGA